MLSSVFRFKLPEISSSPVIKDLIRSFKVETPVCSVRPPVWDLDVVLRYLISSTFEPLSSTTLLSLTEKVVFLVALAMVRFSFYVCIKPTLQTENYFFNHFICIQMLPITTV